MKIIIIAALTLFTVWILTYLIFAFGNAAFDISTWSEPARITCGTAAFMELVLTAAVLGHHYEKP